jgi:hypothetical protein
MPKRVQAIVKDGEMGSAASAVRGPMRARILTALAASVLVVVAASVGRSGEQPGPAARTPLSQGGSVAVPPAPSAGGDVAGFKGFVYPQTASGDEYPAGVEHLGDGVVEGGGFSWAHVRQGSRQMLWLQRFVDSAGSERQVEVVDAVDVGLLDDGYDFLVGRCRYGNGKPDPEIAAMIRFVGEDGEAESGDAARDEAEQGDGEEDDMPGDADFNEFSSDVRAAWRLDRSTGQIVPVDLQGLRCQSEGD